MTTRRDIITSGLGLAGIIAAGRAPAALVRSMVAARAAAMVGGGEKKVEYWASNGTGDVFDTGVSISQSRVLSIRFVIDNAKQGYKSICNINNPNYRFQTFSNRTGIRCWSSAIGITVSKPDMVSNQWYDMSFGYDGVWMDGQALYSTPIQCEPTGNYGFDISAQYSQLTRDNIFGRFRRACVSESYAEYLANRHIVDYVPTKKDGKFGLIERVSGEFTDMTSGISSSYWLFGECD